VRSPPRCTGEKGQNLKIKFAKSHRKFNLQACNQALVPQGTKTAKNRYKQWYMIKRQKNLVIIIANTDKKTRKRR
jgi:hypothetical protein